MVYEKEKDCYYCSQGKVLKAIGTKARKTATGYVSEKTLYCCEECTDCPVKSSCIKGNHWKIPEKERYKTLEVARKFEEQRAESLARITSKQGILLRINRSIQAEGSFAAFPHHIVTNRLGCSRRCRTLHSGSRSGWILFRYLSCG